MAIFKKIFVSETSSSLPKKISNIITPPTFNRNIIQPIQQPQESSITSCSSSFKEQQSVDAAGAGVHDEDVPSDLEDLCFHLYNRTLRRADIRLVVFSEKDHRLLYDSETVLSISDKIVAGSHLSKCGRFQFLPHRNDTLRIAKMLFGTLSTSLKSDSLKIHTLRDSNSIMVSRVFSVPRVERNSSMKSSDLYKCMVGSLSSDSDNQSTYSTIRSLEGITGRDDGISFPGRFPLISSKTFINPDPPEKFVRIRNSSLQLESNDVEDIMEELRAFSPNRLSKARRRQLSQIGLDDNLSIRLSNRSRLSSCSSVTDGCGDSTAEWKQYGFAVLIPGEFRSFIFQHILQVERELDRLVVQIHKAVQDKSQFFQTIYNGWTTTAESLCLLCNSLRLKNPVWLSLASSEPEKKDKITIEFCEIAANLIRTLNTKDNKFFMSTPLSAVLMHQLTWVASVAPPEKCQHEKSLILGTSAIQSTHMSYNPTIAQLLELYCGVSSVHDGLNHFIKIVVIGENQLLISQLLFVLSYFIRCSSVESLRDELPEISKEENVLHDFGRSLLAGVCNSYSPHFVLSGISTKVHALDDVYQSIFEDVRHPLGEPCTNSQLMLTLSPSNSQAIAINTEVKSQSLPTQQRLVKNLVGQSSPEKSPKPTIIEEKKKSLVVAIDLHNFAVRLISADNCQIENVPFICPSDSISSMLEEFVELYDHKCAPDFLISFIEDQLGSLLTKSSILVNLLTTPGKEPLTMEKVASILNCDCTDLRLILNIASLYAPGILSTAL